MLERLYVERGELTLFDFDGYDHHQLGVSFKDVINCPTRICGHAFVLAMMLTYGSEFRIDDLPTMDQSNQSIQSTTRCTLDYRINVVNRKTFKGHSEYIGRNMPGLPGSPLGNQFKIQPHGPYSREQSVLTLYRKWLWKEMQDANSAAYLELIRLTELAKKQTLTLSCWCEPELCHGIIVKNAIKFLIQTKP